MYPSYLVSSVSQTFLRTNGGKKGNLRLGVTRELAKLSLLNVVELGHPDVDSVLHGADGGSASMAAVEGEKRSMLLVGVFDLFGVSPCCFSLVPEVTLTISTTSFSVMGTTASLMSGTRK